MLLTFAHFVALPTHRTKPPRPTGDGRQEYHKKWWRQTLPALQYYCTQRGTQTQSYRGTELILLHEWHEASRARRTCSTTHTCFPCALAKTITHGVAKLTYLPALSTVQAPCVRREPGATRLGTAGEHMSAASRPFDARGSSCRTRYFGPATPTQSSPASALRCCCLSSAVVC